MLHITPTYYTDFRCIAGACRHSCCIGWEIDIDAATAAYYDELPGPMGARLRENIETAGGPHFRLGPGERCPFLNGDNLCELILTLGEEALCDICAEHPRFHNAYPDRLESGLGLCCEAAAALILGREAPLVLTPAVPTEDGLLRLRDELLALLTDRTKPLRARCAAALARCGGAFPRKSTAHWAALYLSLEQLDPAWTAALERLRDAPAVDFDASVPETEYEQLLCYFVYRHFRTMAEEAGPAAALRFALLSCAMVAWLQASEGARTFARRVELARQYSAEIEYSDENPARLLAALAK